MAYVSKKRRFPMISAGTIKAFIFIILVGTAIGFWLYTQKIFSQVREFQNTVVKTQVQIYLSIINPELTYESGLSSELFDAAVRKAPYPFIFTDEQLNPIQYYWHNVGIAQNDTSHAAQQKLKKLVKKMDRTNPPEQVPMPALDTIIDTLTVYEMPSGRDTSIVITDENEKYLNSRNVHIDPEDTLAVQNMLHEIDSYSHPVRFRKENAATLIFHGIRSPGLWSAVIVRNDGDPLYWYGVNVSVNDTTLSGREKLTKIIEDISTQGSVYSVVAPYKRQVEKIWLFHYGDLPFLLLIGWLPVIELVVILILISIGFMGLMNIKNAEQRSIWVGMAKETAHQLGTPISSLSGWLELLKTDTNTDMLNKALPEMEYDSKRLIMVAERFSNVGSQPELKPINISDVLNEVLDYFRARVPRMGKSVVLKGHYDGLKPVKGNKELLNWAFENLVKNSLNAIESNQGLITINGEMTKDFEHVLLDFKDNGKGIASANQKKIMKPGFTTKKRGWGLGLSLVKRIIEDYHGGKVFLVESKLGEGTTIRVVIPTVR